MKLMLLLMMLLIGWVGCATAQPTTGQSTRQKIEATYMSQVGVREHGTANHGSDVAKYLQSTGLNEGYAWCAAFVNWTYRQHGVDCPQNAAWSPNWFPQKRLLDVTRYDPQPGDVFGLYFSNKKRIAHVGLIHRYNTHYCMTVEGNTNDAGSREGDGVYMKRRLTRQIYRYANWIDDDSN